MGYGYVTPTDIDTLERAMARAVSRLKGRRPMRVLEVGTCAGDTSRGMRAYLASLEVVDLDFWGVDSQRDMPSGPPFAGAHMVIGESVEVYHQVPGEFDFIFIDGCHCINHVMLDFLHYGDKLAELGVLAFHDASPLAQRKCDYQGHGPRLETDFGTACREALRKLGLAHTLRADWRLVEEAWDATADWGGVAVFERTMPRVAP